MDRQTLHLNTHLTAIQIIDKHEDLLSIMFCKKNGDVNFRE